MLKHKDLLGMRGMPPEEIGEILDTAQTMKTLLTQNSKRTPHLQGKSIVTLFYENSTRTRMSFELASKYMSSASANIAASSSSVAKGETLIDTGRTLARMGTDVIIIRHPMSFAPHLMAKHVNCSVINAGDGTNEHPTQSLLDLLTIRQQKGGFKGLRVAIVGDVSHSRVARSNIFALSALGAEVVLSGPPTMLPVDNSLLGVRFEPFAREAVAGADVVMALRIQRERQEFGLFPTVNEYCAHWAIDRAMMALADKDAIIMHPGPMNRGVEIASDVADCPESFVDEQVTNGVAVRMALMYMLTRRAA